MNILSYLTPKIQLEYVYDDFTVRQIMEKMNHHRYSVIPVLKRTGEYVTSVSDGDILRAIFSVDFDREAAENLNFYDLEIYRPYKPINISSPVDEVLQAATNQNFLPMVDDRNMFIGIIKRRNIIINYIESRCKD